MDEPSQSEDRKLSAMEHVKKRHEEKGFLYAWSVRSQQYNLDVLDKRCSASAESAQSYVFGKHQNKFTHSFVGCIMLNTEFFFPCLQRLHVLLLLLLLRGLRALPGVLLLLWEEGRVRSVQPTIPPPLHHHIYGFVVDLFRL